MKTKQSNVNIFQETVESTSEIKNCYQSGLQALGKHSKKIELGDHKFCEGSVDIDTCLKNDPYNKYSRSNRWDYCFSYKGEVYFIEVHGAITAEVSVVLKKLKWLKDWLHQEAPKLNRLKAKSKTPYYWIQSDNFDIPKTSSQYRTIVQAGIKPIPKLKLE